MLVITDKGSFEIMDYSQLSYEDGVWVIETFDLDTYSIQETSLEGGMVSVVN